ncbi:hypothetical protein COO60DRAFT_1499246 [Scenedesmus sp. NREL 46B-D3]|nr:hypothetical protein COO60DRAFT_1499246 [Scenedesmus sp. NREL 46B-D3]
MEGVVVVVRFLLQLFPWCACAVRIVAAAGSAAYGLAASASASQQWWGQQLRALVSVTDSLCCSPAACQCKVGRLCSSSGVVRMSWVLLGFYDSRVPWQRFVTKVSIVVKAAVRCTTCCVAFSVVCLVSPQA